MLCHDDIRQNMFKVFNTKTLTQSHKPHQSLPDSTTIRQPYAKYQTMTSCSPNQLQCIQRAITNLSTVIQNGHGKMVVWPRIKRFVCFLLHFPHCMYVRS